GKKHALIVVAEGARNNAEALTQHFRRHEIQLGFELRATTLGHVQRGGNPTAFDRLLATRLGVAAVEALIQENYGVLAGWINGRVHTTPLDEVVSKVKALDLALLDMAGMLSR